MLGFRLLFLGLFGLFKKFPHALGVSVVPGFLLFVGLTFLAQVSNRVLHFQSVFWVLYGGGFLLTIPLLSWAAINWHRVVLLNEFPAVYPRLKDWTWAKFTLRLTVLTGGLVGFYFGFFYLLDLLITEVMNIGPRDLLVVVTILTTAFIAYLSSTWVALRLLPSLSSTAIQEPLTFRQSWRQAGDYNGAIIVISLAMLFITIGTIILTAAVFPSGFVGLPLVVWLVVAMHVAVSAEFYSYIRAQNDVRQVFE